MSLGRVTTLLVMSRAVRFGVGLVNSVIIARTLGVEGLGVYAYAMGVAAFFGLLPNMGIATIVTRTIARDPEAGNDLVSTALRAQALVSSVTLVVIPAAAALLPGQPVPIGYVWLAGAQLTLGTLSWPYLGVLSGLARYDYVALSELASAVSGTLCLVAAALFYGTGAAFLTAHVAASILAVVAARSLARPFIRKGAGRSMSVWRLLRNGVPFGATAAAESVYTRLDVLLLGQMASTTALGLYNVAYKPTNLVVYFGTTLAGPLFPLMARDPQAAPPPSFRRALRGMGLLAPAMALFFTGLALPMIRLLYGDDFAGASPVLIVLVWSAAAHWLYAPLSVALQARGMERLWLYAIVAALTLNLTGNLWAIPRFGVLGAAGATLVSEVVLLSLAAVMAIRCFRQAPSMIPVLLNATAAGLAGGILWIAAPGGPVIATLASLLAYAIAVLSFRLVGAEDAATVLGWIRQAVPFPSARARAARSAGAHDVSERGS